MTGRSRGRSPWATRPTSARCTSRADSTATSPWTEAASSPPLTGPTTSAPWRGRTRWASRVANCHATEPVMWQAHGCATRPSVGRASIVPMPRGAKAPPPWKAPWATMNSRRTMCHGRASSTSTRSTRASSRTCSRRASRCSIPTPRPTQLAIPPTTTPPSPTVRPTATRYPPGRATSQGNSSRRTRRWRMPTAARPP